MYKISVIVPVYNVEKYFQRCIESIIGQTYQNLEIILIDDGSTDSSAKMCDDYAKKDSRIIVIHKENSGVSASRNAGLELATGEYIAFVDSDDWLDNNMYSDLLDISLKYDSDITECGYRYIKNEGTLIVDKENTGEIKEYTNISSLEALYFGDQIWGGISIVLWNKLYKRKVFSSLRFMSASISEDSEIMPKILYSCKKIVKINSNWYNFNIRPNSLSRSKFNIKDLSSIDAHKSVSDFFKEHLKTDDRLAKISEYTDSLYYDSYYTVFCLCYENRKIPEYRNASKEIEKKVDELYKKNLFCKTLKKKLFNISPVAYYCMRKLLHKFGHFKWLMRQKKNKLKQKFSKK